MKNNSQPRTFKNPWNYKPVLTSIKDKVMTVPGLALTNTEHMKKVQMGLAEKTVKVIYDPENNLPDIRMMDLLDQKIHLKEVREQVQAIRALRAQYLKEQEAKATAEKEREEEERFAAFEKKFKDKQKQKEP